MRFRCFSAFAVTTTIVAGLAGCGSGDGETDVAPLDAPAVTLIAGASTTPPAATVQVSSTPAPPSPTASTPVAAVATEPPAPVVITAPPSFTMEELNGTLGQAASDWAAAPSGASYDVLAAGATAVLATGRPLPPGTDVLLDRLTTYPGSDALVLAIFDQLGPALPAVDRAAFVTTTLSPAPRPVVDSPSDPRFDTCKDAKAAGYGPYSSGDAEYGWYRDADGDGTVCE